MAWKPYKTKDAVVRDNGATHSHIVTVGAVEVTIPEHAEQRPGSDGDYWNWTANLKGGGRINIQAYTGQPGETLVLDAEVREKMLPKSRGGHKFLYMKLKPSTVAKPTMQMHVGDGTTLLRAEAMKNAAVTTVWAPQQQHYGGVVFASINAPMPEPRAKSRKVSR